MTDQQSTSPSGEGFRAMCLHLPKTLMDAVAEAAHRERLSKTKYIPKAVRKALLAG
jgi:hypothetical protein